MYVRTCAHASAHAHTPLDSKVDLCPYWKILMNQSCQSDGNADVGGTDFVYLT